MYSRTTNFLVTSLLSITAVVCVVVLPGLPVSRASVGGASMTSGSAGQKLSRRGIDGARREALQRLYEQLKAGDPFSEEEERILNEFAEGVVVSDLEADVAISRALYNYYIAGIELTKQQEELLNNYHQFVSRRSVDVADLKHQLLNRRLAAEISAPPRNTPLVAPANDLCSGAEVIPGAGPFPYLTAVTADITDATTTGDPPIPSCVTPPTVSRSMWYTFTPAVTADYIISSCADAPTATTVDDTVMGIYTSSGGCAGPFTELPTAGATDGCDDDSCPTEAFQAVIETRLNAGAQYFILVWEFGTSPPTSGNTAVQLRVSRFVVPANDVCLGATALALNTPVNGTTASAGADYSLSGATCFVGPGNTSSTAAGRDVVYSFTAPTAGNYSFKVTGYDETKNLVLYYSTSCPAPGTLSCSVAGPVLAAANRLGVGTSEELFCVALSAAQQIFVFVDEDAITEGSTFTIEATRCTLETEPNDTPATATAIATGIQGSISSLSDVDYYSIGTPAPGSRVFALVDGISAVTNDFDLRVTTTTDTLEFDDSNSDFPFGSLSACIAGTPTTGTPTFLQVKQSTAASEPYRLYSAVQPPIATATAEVEPNNSLATATSAPNNYFTGSLPGPAPSTDEDFFSFTAAAGTLVFVGLDGDPLRDNTPINAKLDLLDSNGVALISVNDFGSTSSTTSGAGNLNSTTPSSPAEGLVFRIRATGTYYVKVSIGTVSTAGSGAGDYLLSIVKSQAGQGTETIGLYDPASSTFFLRNSNSSAPADLVFGYGPAGAGWKPIAGDWNGDGTDTVGLYNPATGFFFLRNANSTANADLVFSYGPGGAGWIPLAGDWNGDGVDTVGLYDPATGIFFLRNSNSSGPADIVFSYGPAGAGWIPIVGDWNGDGVDTIGLYNPATSTFFLRNSNSSAPADIVFTYGPAGAGWIPIIGDWNADGTDTIGLYNPASSTFFLRNANSSANADLVFSYGPGGAGWIPIAADWDGL